MNKKVILAIAIILIILVIGLAIFFSIQGNNTNNPSSSNIVNDEANNAVTDDNTNIENGNNGILIAYYSNSGNTKAMAEEIQNQTGGDIFEIKRVAEYTNMYQEAEKEINDNERPEVADMPENLNQYDMLFIGYPIWWDTTPAMINTFLENYDLSNKTVIPFCTSSSDGIEGSMASIRESAPNANILDGLRISGSSARNQNGKDEITDWLNELNIID